jgi:hypothetical protein
MPILLSPRGSGCLDRSGVTNVSGSVKQFSSSNLSVTVTNPSGKSKQFATRATANMAFNDGDKELPNLSETTETLTMTNIEPAESPTVFLKGNDVLPSHDITDSGINSSVTFTEA